VRACQKVCEVMRAMAETTSSHSGSFLTMELFCLEWRRNVVEARVKERSVRWSSLFFLLAK